MPDQAIVITDLIVPPNIANALGGYFARQLKAITSISIVHRQMFRSCVAATP
jgi:hypothetical protein